MPCALAGVVLSMLGKLDREAMKRTFVQARDESLNSLLSQKLKPSE
jgi:hypothetical protein